MKLISNDTEHKQNFLVLLGRHIAYLSLFILHKSHFTSRPELGMWNSRNSAVLLLQFVQWGLGESRL